MSALSALYGRAVELRRSWYTRRHTRARLPRPVISVGNLVVGGSGKTPVVAALARLLQSSGERPAVLTRGYARRRRVEGVVVVSDAERVLGRVDESGDEPLMLARALPGVPVLVSPDRYLAGTLAGRRFGATVMILDDGFQHLQLARDVDLLVIAPADLGDRVLPAGRLREPLSAARNADALLVYGSADDASRVRETLGVEASFTVSRRYHPARAIGHANARGTRVLAVAAIAQPHRFFTALRDNGFEPLGEIAFRDHHWFTAADVSRITDRARSLHADAIVTTEKDAVRVEALVADGAASLPWLALPMDVVIEPEDRFAPWLRSRLATPDGGRAGQ